MRCMVNRKGNKKIYRLVDLARRLDRDKTTLLRWEAEGKIPKARRDTRGWRYYTPEDFTLIVRLVEEQFYFRGPGAGEVTVRSAVAIPVPRAPLAGVPSQPLLRSALDGKGHAVVHRAGFATGPFVSEVRDL